MASTIQFKRGTQEEGSLLTLLEGEIFIDLDNKTLIIHDGIQQGGYSLPITSLSNIVDDIQFTGGTGTQGTISWNADEETLDLIQNGAVLQLGQELQTHVRNNSGSDISDGTVVMASGTIGASGRITVVPYDGTSDLKYIVGVTTETIVNGEDGKVTTFGKVRGVDTSLWSDGDILYVSSGGQLTNIEPNGVKNSIAFVVNSHTNGTIMVRFTPINENYTQIVSAPSSATDVGKPGQIAYDSNYFYVCISTNTWVRSPLTSW